MARNTSCSTKDPTSLQWMKLIVAVGWVSMELRSCGVFSSRTLLVHPALPHPMSTTMTGMIAMIAGKATLLSTRDFKVENKTVACEI